MMDSGSRYTRRLIDPLLDEVLTSLPAVLLVGPRGSGKTTTALQRAGSVIRLDVPSVAAAFRADPDAALRGRREPILIDEWQAVPEAFGAVKRAVDLESRAGRFLLTGSAYADIEGATAAGTGRITRLLLPGMTERELHGDITSRSLIDRIAQGDEITADSEIGLADYLQMALASGFPEAAALDSRIARELWLEGYVTQITTRDATGAPSARDPARLRRYLEAYALNSAGIVEAKTLYEAAGVDKKTAGSYERLLENVFVTEALPPWTSNRLKRLVLAPKRYVTDPGLMAAVLRVDTEGIIQDARLIGCVIDTFVLAQLRGELIVSESRPRLFHLRQRDGSREIDLIVELGGSSVIAIEIKAAAAVSISDARHLIWLRDQLGDRFRAGVVLHTGPHSFRLSDRITALPISAIWS